MSLPPARRHLVLVGMMGSGKTTVGGELARRLGRRFIDSDAQVEARAGQTVRELFEHEGEPAFRRLESHVLAQALATPDPAVIAAAGGVVLDPGNRRLLRDCGVVVWLRARPDTLASRVAPGGHRPLLAHDAAGVLDRLATERRALYAEVADEVVDVDGRKASDVVETILGLLP